jgi:hypothetical protein
MAIGNFKLSANGFGRKPKKKKNEPKTEKKQEERDGRNEKGSSDQNKIPLS